MPKILWLDVGINTYYSFIGLPNPADYQSDWNNNPPSPKDNFDQRMIIGTQ